MKIAITGATGHIGAHLISVFAKEMPRAELILVHRGSNRSRYSSAFFPKGSRYQLIEADVTKQPMQRHLEGVSFVIHLAGSIHVCRSFSEPQAISEQNLAGTRNVLSACADLGIPLVFPSTTSVYGTQKPEIGDDPGEDDLRPQSPYAATKLLEERAIREVAESKRVSYVILRLGSIFGVSPGMTFHTAVNKFCWQAVTGEPLTVWETAWNQTRPYLDVADATAAILWSIRHFAELKSSIYNVVTMNMTISNLIEVIRRQWPQLRTITLNHPAMNTLSFSVIPRKLLQGGFVFQGDLPSAVRETLSFIQRLRKKEAA